MGLPGAEFEVKIMLTISVSIVLSAEWHLRLGLYPRIRSVHEKSDTSGENSENGSCAFVHARLTSKWGVRSHPPGRLRTCRSWALLSPLTPASREFLRRRQPSSARAT